MDREGLLVIGFGSDLRGDDAAGPIAARRLAERGFTTLAVHQLTPELAENISRSRAVIFLDAHAGVPPGEIRVESIEPARTSAFEHQPGPAGLLRLAEEAFQARPRAWLIGIGGSGFGLGAAPTPQVQQAIARAVEEVEAMFPR